MNLNNHKPSSTILTDDFNAWSFYWRIKRINTTKGSKLLSDTSWNDFSQLINEPTHIQINNSSCIDLIFTDQPMLSVNSGVLYIQFVITE